MRLRSFLRDKRIAAGLSVRDVARITGLAVGEVSMIERGHQLPREEQVAAMRTVYGDSWTWYPVGVYTALHPEIRSCPGCDEELPPSASRQRVYHDERCRRAATNRRAGGGRTAAV